MNFNDPHIDLYDRYLRGEMTAAELESFGQRLAADKDFADAFAVHRIIVEGIKDRGRQDLKEFLSANAVAPANGKLRFNRMYYAAAAAVVAFVSLFVISHFYTSPGPGKEIALKTADKAQSDTQGRQPISPEMAKSLEESNMDKPMSRSEKFEEVIALAPEEVTGESLDEAPAMEEPGILSDVPPGAGEQDVYVAADKKLSDTVVNVPVLLAMLDDDEAFNAKMEQKSSNVETTSSNVRYKKSRKWPANVDNNASRSRSYDYSEPAVDTVSYRSGKKNKDQVKEADKADSIKAAGVSKALKKDAGPSFKIEYWQSPVNFRGYKYIGNTLRFYGLSRHNTRVFMLNGLLYLRTDGMVYKLSPCQDGCAYKSELDSKIVDYIIQQP